jgi:CHAT domain-containing protein
MMNVPKVSLSVLVIFSSIVAIDVTLSQSRSMSFESHQPIAQTPTAKKAEADRLFQQGIKEFNTKQYQAALGYFEAALILYQSLAKEIKDPQLKTATVQSQGQVLGQISNIYFRQENYVNAIKYAEQFLTIAREIKNPQLEVMALGTLALPYQATGNFQKAVKLQEEHQEIFQKNQAPWVAQLQGTFLLTLCDAYLFLKDDLKAINCHERGLTITRQYHNNPDVNIKNINLAAEFKHLLGLGIIYKQKNQYQPSINFLEAAYTIHSSHNNNYLLVSKQSIDTLFESLGVNYFALGDTNKAIYYFHQQLSSADIQKKGDIYSLLGFVYLAQNKYDVSLDYFNKAIINAQENKNQSLELTTNRIIAGVYSNIGDTDRAIEFENKALKLSQNLSNCSVKIQNNLSSQQSDRDFITQQYQKANCQFIQQMEIQSLARLGSLYIASENQKYTFNEGIKYITQGLELSQKLKKSDEEAMAFQYLGSAYAQRENWNDAIKYYEKALNIASSTTDASNYFNWNFNADLLQSLAIAHAKNGNIQEALKIQLRAELLNKTGSNLRGLAISRSRGGYLYFVAKDTAKAEKLLVDAIDKFELILSSGVGKQDSNRISFFNSYLFAYQTLIEVSIAQNKPNQALEISERGRARILAELLSSSPIATKNTNIITQTPKINIQQIQQIAKQQNATLVEYQIIYDKSRVTSNLLQNKKPLLYPVKLLIWVIKPNGEIVFHQSNLPSLQQKTSLENLITDTLTSISQDKLAVNPTRDNNPLTFKIGDRVKLKDDMAKDPPWIVVGVNSDTLTLRQPSYPDEQTSTYPIASVVEKIGANGSQSSANAKSRNLQQLYQLLVAPIAKHLPKREDERVIFIPQQELFAVPFPALQDANGRYLIEKHPILTAPSIQVLQLTARQQRIPSTNKDVLLVGNPIMPKVAYKPGETPQQLPQLEGTAAEVNAIAPLFQTSPIVGKDATKQTILSLLPKARIAHFATHGILDDLRGLGSAIALTPAGNDNGLLTAEEIFDLKLNADLVVISACNTGKGRITGDGVIGLSRSLMNAGVPSLVVSLWSVNDRSTTTLMTEFYRNLQQKKLDKARSLQKAMQSMIQNNYSPYDWAAFNLIGNAE